LAPLHERIDQAIEARLSGAVAPVADDAEFIRRVTLDLIGMTPTSDEVRQFLSDPSSVKRQQWIDRLLASPQYARRMQNVFDLMLMERRPDVHVPAAEWQEYLRNSFAENKPYDQLVREILSADGSEAQSRAASKFYLDRGGDPNLLTRDVGRLFLGMDFQCCQCHDHPLIGHYAQDYYYGIFAFLNRTVVFTDKQTNRASLAEKADGEVTFKSVFIKDMQPQHATPHLPDEASGREPKLPAGYEYAVAPADNVRPVPRFSRRAGLGAALTSDNQRRFDRNIANRLWALMFGRGLVDPVDLHHPDNPPSHPELLEILAESMSAMQYDVRAILREIALSRTYQRASEMPGVDLANVPPESYAVANLKPLSPEQFTWSLLAATGVLENYRTAVTNELRADPRLVAVLAADPKRQELEQQLIERTVYERLAPTQASFVQLFGNQPGTPDGGKFEATIHQALFLSNGGVVDSWLAPGGNSLLSRLTALTEPTAVAEELYMSTLSRRPTADELSEVTLYLNERAGQPRDAVLKELAWALLASAEFRLNH
jgi:hypothetical protein